MRREIHTVRWCTLGMAARLDLLSGYNAGLRTIQIRGSRMTQERVLQRRQFLAGAACAVPLAFSANRAEAKDAQAAEAIDFSRSFCYYDADHGQLWVRVNVECRCEVFDRSTGASDEYLPRLYPTNACLVVRRQLVPRTDRAFRAVARMACPSCSCDAVDIRRRASRRLAELAFRRRS